MKGAHTILTTRMTVSENFLFARGEKSTPARMTSWTGWKSLWTPRKKSAWRHGQASFSFARGEKSTPTRMKSWTGSRLLRTPRKKSAWRHGQAGNFCNFEESASSLTPGFCVRIIRTSEKDWWFLPLIVVIQKWSNGRPGNYFWGCWFWFWVMSMFFSVSINMNHQNERLPTFPSIQSPTTYIC